MVVRKGDTSVLAALTCMGKLSFKLALKVLWVTVPTIHHPDT